MQVQTVRVLIRSLKFIVLYIVYFFVCIEILTRMALAIPFVFNHIIDLSIDCDAARRLKWVDQYINRPKELESIFGVYDPTKGWALKPNIHNMAVFNNKVFNSNAKGIRGTVEYSYAKNPDKTRILILGDSFTFGEEVSDNETYPFYLQQMIPSTEVINLGIPGYGHDQMLIYLKEEGIKYHPDIVILGFLIMDKSRNMLTFRDYAKPKFKAVNGKLTLVNSPVPSPQEIIKQEFFKPKCLDLLSILYRKWLLGTKLYGNMKNELTEAILDEISATSKSIGAVPVFVFLDARRTIDKTPQIDASEKQFNAFCEHSGVAHRIILRSYFAAAEKNNIALKTTRHFSPQENNIVAQGIADYLIDHCLIKTKK